MDAHFSVSLYRDAYDNAPQARTLSWRSLCLLLTSFDVVDDLAVRENKKLLPAWSPTLYPSRARRSAETVLELSCLVLDVDDGTPIEAGRAPWWAWSHIVHTSWSHTPEAPRWRLVVPLARPVPAGRWARAWQWAATRAGCVDPTCKDASRMYFRPARRPDQAHEAHVHIGPAGLLELDLDALPPAADELAHEHRRARLAAASQLAERPLDRRALADRLKVSEDGRRAAARALDARLAGEGGGERAQGATCPRCGRQSVWWPIVPRGQGKALCSHRNRCGWTGWLDELLAAHGVALEVTR